MNETVSRDPVLGVDLPGLPVLDTTQAGHLRHIVNLAHQADWSHMGSRDPGQEWLDSYRYQLAQMAYALALTHYHHLPAARGVFQPAYERLVDKMLHPDVWDFWHATSAKSPKLTPPGAFTGFRPPWRDPVRKENIMFSGHLLLMAALHAVLFDSDRYYAPGALTMTWAPLFQGPTEPEHFVYDIPALEDAIYWQMADNGFLGVACEPGCVFIVCNQFPMIAFRMIDVRRGGRNRAGEVTRDYLHAWQRQGLLDADGMFPEWLFLDFDALMPAMGVGTNAWASSMMHAWNRDFVREVYPRQLERRFKPGPDGELSLYATPAAERIRAATHEGRTPNLTDDLSFQWHDPTLGYVAALLSEVGDERLQGLLLHADRHMQPTWRDGGLYYPREDDSYDAHGNLIYVDPLTGNAMLAYARLNRPDGLHVLYQHPWEAEHFSQPHISAISTPTPRRHMAPQVDLRRAVYHPDSSTLLITLAAPHGSEGVHDVALTIAGAPPGRPWTLHRDGVAVADTHQRPDPTQLAVGSSGPELRLRCSISRQPTTFALRWN